MSTAAVGHVCFDSAVFFPLKESEKNLNDLAHEGRNGILMINPELVSTHLYTHTRTADDQHPACPDKSQRAQYLN